MGEKNGHFLRSHYLSCWSRSVENEFIIRGMGGGTVNTLDEFVISKLQEVLDDVSTAAPVVSDGEERSSTKSLSAPTLFKGLAPPNGTD